MHELVKVQDLILIFTRVSEPLNWPLQVGHLNTLFKSCACRFVSLLFWHPAVLYSAVLSLCCFDVVLFCCALSGRMLFWCCTVLSPCCFNACCSVAFPAVPHLMLCLVRPSQANNEWRSIFLGSAGLGCHCVYEHLSNQRVMAQSRCTGALVQSM